LSETVTTQHGSHLSLGPRIDSLPIGPEKRSDLLIGGLPGQKIMLAEEVEKEIAKVLGGLPDAQETVNLFAGIPPEVVSRPATADSLTGAVQKYHQEEAKRLGEAQELVRSSNARFQELYAKLEAARRSAEAAQENVLKADPLYFIRQRISPAVRAELEDSLPQTPDAEVSGFEIALRGYQNMMHELQAEFGAAGVRPEQIKTTLDETMAGLSAEAVSHNDVLQDMQARKAVWAGAAVKLVELRNKARTEILNRMTSPTATEVELAEAEKAAAEEAARQKKAAEEAKLLEQEAERQRQREAAAKAEQDKRDAERSARDAAQQRERDNRTIIDLELKFRTDEKLPTGQPSYMPIPEPLREQIKDIITTGHPDNTKRILELLRAERNDADNPWKVDILLDVRKSGDEIEIIIRRASDKMPLGIEIFTPARKADSGMSVLNLLAPQLLLTGVLAAGDDVIEPPRRLAAAPDAAENLKRLTEVYFGPDRNLVPIFGGTPEKAKEKAGQFVEFLMREAPEALGNLKADKTLPDGTVRPAGSKPRWIMSFEWNETHPDNEDLRIKIRPIAEVKAPLGLPPEAGDGYEAIITDAVNKREMRLALDSRGENDFTVQQIVPSKPQDDKVPFVPVPPPSARADLAEVRETFEEGVIEVPPVELDHAPWRELDPRLTADSIMISEIDMVRTIVRQLGYPVALESASAKDAGPGVRDAYEIFYRDHPNMYSERDWYFFFFNKLPFLFEMNGRVADRAQIFKQFSDVLRKITPESRELKQLIYDQRGLGSQRRNAVSDLFPRDHYPFMNAYWESDARRGAFANTDLDVADVIGLVIEQMQSADTNIRLTRINQERQREVSKEANNPQNFAAIRNLHNLLATTLARLNYERFAPGDADARLILQDAERAATREQEVGELAANNPIAYGMWGPRFRADQNAGFQQEQNANTAVNFFNWFQSRVSRFMTHDAAMDIRLGIYRQTPKEDARRGPYETGRFPVDSFSGHEYLKYLKREGPQYAAERLSSAENIFANVYFTRSNPVDVGTEQAGKYIQALMQIITQLGQLDIKSEADLGRLNTRAQQLGNGQNVGLSPYVQISQLLQNSIEDIYKADKQTSRIATDLQRWVGKLENETNRSGGLVHNYSVTARNTIAGALFFKMLTEPDLWLMAKTVNQDLQNIPYAGHDGVRGGC
jgi:hypothetical protein